MTSPYKLINNYLNNYIVTNVMIMRTLSINMYICVIGMSYHSIGTMSHTFGLYHWKIPVSLLVNTFTWTVLLGDIPY